MTDRNLEEAIFQLQKLNAENGVKQLVEEAAQLLADGRHIEAGALLEKAEAMVSARQGKAPAENHDSATPLSQTEARKPETLLKPDEQVMAKLAGRVADGLSRILTGAFEELERHIIGESRKISTSFEHQLDRLQATVDSLTQLQVRFGELSAEVSSQRSEASAVGQKYEQLSGSVVSLEERSARHEKEVGALRGETQTLSTAVRQELDAFSARLGLHQEEVAGLKSAVSDISHKMDAFIERVDRQGEVLRALTETHARRTAALDELMGVITRLKTPVESILAAGAGPM